MPTKEELNHLREIFEQEYLKILTDYDISCTLKGYDSDVKMVFIREEEDSVEELTYEILKNFEKRVRNEINKRWHVSILYTDVKAAEAYNSQEEKY